MPDKKTVLPADAPGLGRRKFFGTVAVGAAGTAAAVAASSAALAQGADTSQTMSPPPPAPSGPAPVAGPPAAPARAIIGPPSSFLQVDEVGPVPKDMPVNVGKTGSDFMVDVLKTLDFDYCAVLPGSTFRALQESLINYGNNTSPELITCTNEDICTSFAHGYAKTAGKPMLALVHGVVGLQHCTMGLYNAWCDRVPMVVIVGNTGDAAGRASAGAEWAHSALDNGAFTRDFTKWDDQPLSLEHFAMSMVRAKTLATAVPTAPTLIVADNGLGESLMNGPGPYIPAFTLDVPPVGDADAVRQAAKMLAGATAPVILADRLVRSQAGMDNLVQLAETLGAPVIDIASRLNMPSQHPLNLSFASDEVLAKADVIIALEAVNLYGALHKYRDLPHRTYLPVIKPDTKVISISSHDLLMKSNFQDFDRYQPADLAIVGDGEATLPMLIEAVKQAGLGSAVSDRTNKMKSQTDALHKKLRHNATYGWNDSPISVPRLCAEIGYTLKNEDWALVSPQDFQSFWPTKLWNMTKYYQYNGGAGGYGIGYVPGASAGAALAHHNAGRIAVSISGDGELMMNPGALWTMAHHRIPLLTVMHNNRAWHQETMHVQRMADRHSRGITRAVIGTTMRDPDVDFAKLASSFGVWSQGPITDPNDLAPALQQALAVVKQGQPALLDVVSQGR